MKMTLKLLFMSDSLLGIVNFKKCNALKKKISKELMPLVWHPKIWWNFCISEDEKKEIEQTFTE